MENSVVDNTREELKQSKENNYPYERDNESNRLISQDEETEFGKDNLNILALKLFSII